MKPSKECEFRNNLLDKSSISQGCQSGPGGPGGPVGQGGPGDQANDAYGFHGLNNQIIKKT